MSFDDQIIKLCLIIDTNIKTYKINISKNIFKAKRNIMNIEMAYRELKKIKRRLLKEDKTHQLLEDLFLRINHFICLSQLDYWDDIA